MKILKIILLFIVIIGGVFLVSHLDQVIKLVIGEPPHTDSTYIDVEKKCQEVRVAWSKKSDWDPSLFKHQMSDVEQDRQLGRYEFDDEPLTVINTIREESSNKVYDAIFREFHNANCNHSLVEKNYAGVSTLITTFKMQEDNRLKKVRDVKKLYDDISSFTQSPHTIVAKYDASSNSWISFRRLSQNIIDKAAGYRENSLYREELSNITRFKDGLNDSHIRSVVNKQENGFYESLSNQIVSFFNKAGSTDSGLTETNLARFNNAYDKYTRETNLYTSGMAEDLLNFRKKYEEKIKKEDTNN